MKTVEIRVDVEKGRLRVKGTLFAGSKVALRLSGYESETCQVGLYVFDRRVFERSQANPPMRVFPPPGFVCVALSYREEGQLVLNLNTQEVADRFSGGRRAPGAMEFSNVYLWDSATPELTATGQTPIQWSPVYFKPEGSPVLMRGDPGPPGPPGRDGKDAIVGPLTPGQLVQTDATGRHLETIGRDTTWLFQRTTAYRNAGGTLVLTTGMNAEQI